MTLTPGTVGFANVGNNSVSIANALIPKEGPKMVPFLINFPAVSSFDIDLTLTMQQGRISVIQAMYLDLRNATASVSVTVSITNQNITLEAGQQGYFPLLVPESGAKMTVASASTQPIRLMLLNVPVPEGTWNTAAAVLGSVTAAITAPLAPDTAAGVDALAVSQLGGGAVWTDHSVASTTVATSSPLFALVAAGSRTFVRVKAPETADLWVNPKGGTAGISLVGCFKIAAGAMYENFPGESVYEAWTYFCATGALVIFAQTQEGN